MKKMSTDRPQRRNGRGRPGRRGNKVDVKVKLERSRQSARECRARKKLRYQYLEDLVSNREQAIFKLREELELYKHHCSEVDGGVITDDIREKLVKWESENTSEKTTENDVSSENSNSPGCVIKEELSTWCDDTCTRT